MKTLEDLVESKWPEMLSQLRKTGWAVAIHNDYRQSGTHYTFWLFTRQEDGRFLKAEATSDAQAIYQVWKDAGVDTVSVVVCPQCQTKLDVKKGRRDCHRCAIYFECGRWWTVSCDEYHSHRASCLVELQHP